MKKLKMNKTAIVLLSVVLFLGMIGVSYANFSVSPLTIEKSLEPGTTYTDSFKVNNASNQPIVVTIEWSDKTINPAAEWFSINADKITVNSGATYEVPYEIRIPDDAQGLYYVRMIFSQEPPKDVAVGIRKRYNFPIRINVAGTEKYNFTIKHIGVYQEDGTVFKITFVNNSNTFIYPTGQLITTPLDKKRNKELYKIDFNSVKEIVYPSEEYICEGRFLGNMLFPNGSYETTIHIEAGTATWDGNIRFDVEDSAITIFD